MEISDRLKCLFSAEIEESNGSHVIEIPEGELDLGQLRAGETYRVAVLPAATGSDSDSPDPDPEPASEPQRSRQPERDPTGPPVQEGDTRRVEIEDIGEQGDGITRVERGFVVIVPDTDQGERVVIEITDVAETVAFAEVVERISYYE